MKFKDYTSSIMVFVNLGFFFFEWAIFPVSLYAFVCVFFLLQIGHVNNIIYGNSWNQILTSPRASCSWFLKAIISLFFFFLTVSFQTISEKTIFLVVCGHGISYPFRLWSDSVLTETSLNAWSLSQWWSWSSEDPLMYFSEHTSCARHAYGSLNSAEYTGTLKFPNFTKNLSPLLFLPCFRWSILCLKCNLSHQVTATFCIPYHAYHMSTWSVFWGRWNRWAHCVGNTFDSIKRNENRQAQWFVNKVCSAFSRTSDKDPIPVTWAAIFKTAPEPGRIWIKGY